MRRSPARPATIEPSRVRPELRPKLELYQREAARVLRDHFFGPRTAEPGPPPAPTPPGLPLVAPSALVLRRIRAAQHVLDLVEEDLSMLERCGPAEPVPDWKLEDHPVFYRQLKKAVSSGLDWVHTAVMATAAAITDEPSLERWRALSTRSRRLTVSYMRFA